MDLGKGISDNLVELELFVEYSTYNHGKGNQELQWLYPL